MLSSACFSLCSLRSLWLDNGTLNFHEFEQFSEIGSARASRVVFGAITEHIWQ